MRISIILDLSMFRIEYISDSSSSIANKSSWLSSVISSAESLSIDIIYDSDDYAYDNLAFLRYYDTSINDSESSSIYSYVFISSLWIMI